MLFVLTVVAMASCKSGQSSISKSDAHFKELIAIMQGTYSSEKQSIADTTYFNISLRMVPIWKSKGHYLYVEQALFKKQDKPYRVRIYKVSQPNDSTFISEIYTLKKRKKLDWSVEKPTSF